MFTAVIFLMCLENFVKNIPNILKINSMIFLFNPEPKTIWNENQVHKNLVS